MEKKKMNEISIQESLSTETPVVRWLLIGIALSFLFVMLVIPLAAVFIKAFADGVSLYVASITEPAARAAIELTLLTLFIALPLNTVFGLAAAWTITKFEFKGKNILITLIDLPFAISPVIAGVVFVFLFGRPGLGPWLDDAGFKIIYATPGIVLATIFVTFPFMARELIPLMQAQGTTEEEAALILGASGFKTLWHITLPNIKWGLIYGAILTSARAIGEFGAVSVVSGHVRGLTNTVPLHIEILYNEYHFTAAFAVASLLTLLAVITLVVKSITEGKRQNNERVN